MTLDEGRLDEALRAALARDVQERVPNAGPAVLAAVRSKVARDAGARPARGRGRRIVWALAAALLALLVLAGGGLAAAVATQRI